MRRETCEADLDTNEAAFHAMLHRIAGTHPHPHLPVVMTSGELENAMMNFRQAVFWVREHLRIAAALGKFD